LHFIVVDLGGCDGKHYKYKESNLKQGCLVPVLSLWMKKSMLIEKIKM
jgi:hypothetical protein